MSADTSRVRIGAIAAGWLTDLGLSLLFFMVLAGIVGGDGSSAEDVARRMNGSVELLASTLVVGLAFTGIGGYVAAALAKQQHIRHAVAVGLLSLGLGLSSLFAAGPGDQPIWASFASVVLTLPFAAFGGYYRQQTEKKP